MYFSWTSASGESSGRAGVDDLKITEKQCRYPTPRKKRQSLRNRTAERRGRRQKEEDGGRKKRTAERRGRRQKEEDGRKFVCSKHDRAITCLFHRELHLKLPCSCLLQKDLLKERWGLAGIFFTRNYFHACRTRFFVFFPLPSYCTSSLITREIHFNKTLR